MPKADTAGNVAATVAVPRWLPVVSTLLVVAGLAVSGYLTVEHYTAGTTLACPETGVINCQKVTTSAQSAVFGIPVALLGLAFFAAMTPACWAPAWRASRPAIRWARVLFAVTGVGFVFYLIYAELFVLGAICLWCTAVHVITVALFAVIMWGTALVEPVKPIDRVGPVEPVD
jgi:uncharacterized membrane protein